MNQKKIGCFLQELRKEKGMTQEQVAEKFNVSNRTVSRWETGSNMPDISLLVELAEYYNVDIREIIDGEKRSEKMNEEVKEVVSKVADYAEIQKKILLSRMRIINIIGLATGIISMLLPVKDEFWQMLKDCMAGFTVGTVICTLLYTTGVLAKIREYKKARKSFAIIACVAFALVVVGLVMVALSTYTK